MTPPEFTYDEMLKILALKREKQIKRMKMDGRGVEYYGRPTREN